MFVFALFCIALCPFLFCDHLERKRKLVVFLLLSNRSLVTVYVLWLFLTEPWIGLQCVIVVFPEFRRYSHNICAVIVRQIPSLTRKWGSKFFLY